MARSSPSIADEIERYLRTGEETVAQRVVVRNEFSATSRYEPAVTLMLTPRASVSR